MEREGRREASEGASSVRKETISVALDDHRELVNEVARLRRQVEELQARGTALVLENRELRTQLGKEGPW
jgi:hypothetical protein